jgi:flagellum-specific peptidoglycan hydrolase FlgJ
MDLRPLLTLLGAAGVLYYMENKTPPASQTAPEGKAAFVAELSGITRSLTSQLNWPVIVVPVIVAWAAMESAWGTSKLAIQGNNLFGIKAGPTWQAEGKPFDSYPTQEYQGTAKQVNTTATFRHYGSWTESVQDLLNLIKITTVYKPAYDALARGDIQGFYQAIDASGYSTAAKYSNRIAGALDTITGLA